MATASYANALSDFDFMAEPKEPDTPLDQREDDLGKVSKMDNKKFAQSVLDVFELLGGTTWLLGQAKIDPKTFLGMLSKMIPKSIDADDLQGLTLMIVDQYIEGDQKILVNTNRSPALPASAAYAAGGGPAELGQPSSMFGHSLPSDEASETATSGNPPAASRTVPAPIDNVEVIDVFE